MMDSKVVLDIENHKIYCTIQKSLLIKISTCTSLITCILFFPCMVGNKQRIYYMYDVHVPVCQTFPFTMLGLDHMRCSLTAVFIL